MEKVNKNIVEPISEEISEENSSENDENRPSHLKRDKVYKYERNGKTISVRRKWTNFGDKQLKQEALAEYFANFDENNHSKSINALLKEYNSNHELKVSYSMFYKKYVEHFGPRNA